MIICQPLKLKSKLSIQLIQVLILSHSVIGIQQSNKLLFSSLLKNKLVKWVNKEYVNLLLKKILLKNKKMLLKHLN